MAKKLQCQGRHEVKRCGVKEAITDMCLVMRSVLVGLSRM